MEQVEIDGRKKMQSTGEELLMNVMMFFTTRSENALSWIEKDIGIEFGEWEMPVVDKLTMQSTHPKVFFGGDQHGA